MSLVAPSGPRCSPPYKKSSILIPLPATGAKSPSKNASCCNCHKTQTSTSPLLPDFPTQLSDLTKTNYKKIGLQKEFKITGNNYAAELVFG
jgi:hypothetical protein